MLRCKLSMIVIFWSNLCSLRIYDLRSHFIISIFTLHTMKLKGRQNTNRRPQQNTFSVWGWPSQYPQRVQYRFENWVRVEGRWRNSQTSDQWGLNAALEIISYEYICCENYKRPWHSFPCPPPPQGTESMGVLIWKSFEVMRSSKSLTGNEFTICLFVECSTQHAKWDAHLFTVCKIQCAFFYCVNHVTWSQMTTEKRMVLKSQSRPIV